MKNSIEDAGNYLFICMDRLMDDEVCHDEASTKAEIERAKAMADMTGKILDIGKLQLEVMKMKADMNLRRDEIPDTLKLTAAPKHISKDGYDD